MNYNEELERYSSDHDFLKAIISDEKDFAETDQSIDKLTQENNQLLNIPV